MIELQLNLDFACCTCEHSVSVTVKCAGKGLVKSGRTCAGVRIPCPTCGSVNQVYFDPHGTVQAVKPCPGPGQVPEPSLN